MDTTKQVYILRNGKIAQIAKDMHHLNAYYVSQGATPLPNHKEGKQGGNRSNNHRKKAVRAYQVVVTQTNGHSQIHKEYDLKELGEAEARDQAFTECEKMNAQFGYGGVDYSVTNRYFY